MMTTKKKIIIFVVTVIIFGVFLFPKEMTTCGSLAKEKACKTRYCSGLLIKQDYAPPDSKCYGIDLGVKYFNVKLD